MWLELLLSYSGIVCIYISLQIRRPLPSMLNSCLAVSTPKGSTPSLSASSSSTGVFSALDNWDSYWLLHSCWCFCVPVIINTFAVGLIPCSTSTIIGRLLSSVCQDVPTCIIRTVGTRSSVFGCTFSHIYVDYFSYVLCVCFALSTVFFTSSFIQTILVLYNCVCMSLHVLLCVVCMPCSVMTFEWLSHVLWCHKYTALAQCGSVGALYLLEDSLTPSSLPCSTHLMYLPLCTLSLRMATLQFCLQLSMVTKT